MLFWSNFHLLFSPFHQNVVTMRLIRDSLLKLSESWQIDPFYHHNQLSEPGSNQFNPTPPIINNTHSPLIKTKLKQSYPQM